MVMINFTLKTERMATDQPPISQNFVQNGETFEDWKYETTQSLETFIDKLSINNPKYNLLIKEASDVLKDRKLSQRHDEEYGIYPDISDPNFAARLARKTEFYGLRSKRYEENEDPCRLTEFSPTSIQRLVSRFLHPLTPYNGMLLYHGVGVGKTCSAITVAETFLDAAPEKVVYIIAPQAIADGFRRTIFDINRLERIEDDVERKLTGEEWKSPQCTGMTYPRLLDMANNRNKEEIGAAVDKLVKERYKIMGYRAFANWVEKQLAKIPRQTLTAKKVEEREEEILRKLFDDHLLIVDEAHNLRDASVAETDIEITDEPTESAEEDASKRDYIRMSDAAEGKKLTPILDKILRLSRGLRLMLMTATPMYNTAPEIVFLLNLLLLNDTKGSKKLEVSKIFDNNGKLFDYKQKDLVSAIKRYVSYMRGENPVTFPLRLTPDESTKSTNELFGLKENGKLNYPQFSLSRKEFNKKGTGMVSFDNKDHILIMRALPLIIDEGNGTLIGNTLYEYLRNHSTSKDARTEDVKQFDFILDRTMQMGNIMYEDKTFGSDGWDKHFDVVFTDHRGMKLKQFKWKGPVPIESVFGDNLKNHSPKIASIVDKVIEGTGISFVYSRYVKAGALPISIALEVRGWVRTLADGTTLPLLVSDKPRTIKNKYAILTSDDTISPNFNSLLRYVTTFRLNDKKEKEGSKAKAIIGSQVASEGLDLKCIRQIHLLDGWYHLNRIEQIIGRGVRYCSHRDLPKEERNCLIYLHAIRINDYETADLYAYRIAAKKAQPIGSVSRLLKQYSWDCILNYEATVLTGLGKQPTKDAFYEKTKLIKNQPLEDKPFTSACDFKGTLKPGSNEYYCEPYKCGVEIKPGEEVKNKSTETFEDFQEAFLNAKKSLINEFKQNKTVMSVTDALTYFKDIDDESFRTIGLRDVLDNTRIKRVDGVYGTLKLLNNYIVFQPDKVTDLRIPMALRYGRFYDRSQGYMHSTYENPGVILKPIGKEEKPVGKYADAIEKLKQWDETIVEMFNKKTGKLTPRPLIPESFNTSGWRWVLRHFNQEGIRNDARLIALSWYADNYWSNEELFTVLKEWIEHPDLHVEDRKYSELFTKGPKSNRIDLFRGRINGFYIYNTSVGEKGMLQTYCKTGNVIDQCTSNLLADVNSLIGNPIVLAKDVTGKSGTADYFGFLVSKQKTTIFKSADNTKPGSFRGAECDNTSNLDKHMERIRGIYGLFKDSTDTDLNDIKPFLLEDKYNGAKNENELLLKELNRMLELSDEKYDFSGDIKDIIKKINENKAANPKRLIRTLKQKIVKKEFEDENLTAKPIFNDIEDLSHNQTCPYIEFLFRYADMKNIDDKRWFLSVVDCARSGIKMT